MRSSQDWWNDRKTRAWFDQHGRMWDVTLDTDSWAPVTPPIPRFRAPLGVPLEFVKAILDTVSDDPDDVFSERKRTARNELWIDYPSWEANWTQAEQRYYERKRELMRRGFKDEELLLEAGPLPESPEFVRAAHAGNKWVLGIAHPVAGKQWGIPEVLRPLVAAGRLAPRGERDLTLLDAPTRAAVAKFADVEEDVDAPDVIMSSTAGALGAIGGTFGDVEDDAQTFAAKPFAPPEGVDFGDDDEDNDYGLTDEEQAARATEPVPTVTSRRRKGG